MKTIVHKQIEIKIPRVPNFILLEGSDDEKIPITDFDKDQLRTIGEIWTQNLIERAEKQRKLDL